MDKKISDYFDKQKSPQKEICLALREILLKAFPKIDEEIRWGVPVYDNGRYYIGAVKCGVNFGFAVNGLTEEERGLFGGSGKTMGSIKVESINEIDEQKLTALIRLVKEKTFCG